MADYTVIEKTFREFGPPYFVAARQRYEIGRNITIGGQPFVFAREVPIETAHAHWLSLCKDGWTWEWGDIEGYPYAYELDTD